MRELVAEVFCKEAGCSKGRGGSMHIIDPAKGVMGSIPIVGGTISLALGAALASKIRKDKKVTVSFFGDGATGEGVLYESLNFAALKKLPIIFACENNFYSTHLPIRECRPENDIIKIGKPFCIQSYKVNGNNVLKVYEAASKAVEFCRNGEGPILIEFTTYRLRGHVGPDDNIQGTHTDIRPKEDIDRWMKRDPIMRFGKYLMRNGLFAKKDLEGIKRRIEKEVEASHIYAKQSPHPKDGELTRYVFEE